MHATRECVYVARYGQFPSHYKMAVTPFDPPLPKTQCCTLIHGFVFYRIGFSAIKHSASFVALHLRRSALAAGVNNSTKVNILSLPLVTS